LSIVLWANQYFYLIMPDVPDGKSSVIGRTLTLSDRIASGPIGVDIGCGILAVRLDVNRLDLPELDKRIHEKRLDEISVHVC